MVLVLLCVYLTKKIHNCNKILGLLKTAFKMENSSFSIFFSFNISCLTLLKCVLICSINYFHVLIILIHPIQLLHNFLVFILLPLYCSVCETYSKQCSLDPMSFFKKNLNSFSDKIKMCQQCYVIKNWKYLQKLISGTINKYFGGGYICIYNLTLNNI